MIAKIGIHTNAGRVYGYEILLGFGVGAYLQTGYSVIQGVLDPIHMSYGVTFMLLGPVSSLARKFIALLMICTGQLGGIALALSISGAVFVNTALNSLQKLLPSVPRQQLQSAISGTSGDYFATLDPEVESSALDILMGSLQKVSVILQPAVNRSSGL